MIYLRKKIIKRNFAKNKISQIITISKMETDEIIGKKSKYE